MLALTSIERIHQAAFEKREADESFAAVIRQAHADGVTLRAIAEAAGLSHQRIHQIVNHR